MAPRRVPAPPDHFLGDVVSAACDAGTHSRDVLLRGRQTYEPDDDLEPGFGRFSKQPRDGVASQSRFEGKAGSRFDREFESHFSFLPSHCVCVVEGRALRLSESLCGLVRVEVLETKGAEGGPSERTLTGSVDARKHENGGVGA